MEGELDDDEGDSDCWYICCALLPPTLSLLTRFTFDFNVLANRAVAPPPPLPLVADVDVVYDDDEVTVISEKEPKLTRVLPLKLSRVLYVVDVDRVDDDVDVDVVVVVDVTYSLDSLPF